MKARIYTLAATIIAVLMILALFSLVTGFLQWIIHVSAQNGPAALGALAIIVVAVVSYITTKAVERKRAIDTATYERRVKVYDEMIQFFMDVLMNSDENTKKTFSKSTKFMKKITPQLVTYGSNAVIKKWGKFRLEMGLLASKGEVKKLFLGLEGLLLAMRKDLGHSAFTMQKGDVTRLFINDIDEYLKK